MKPITHVAIIFRGKVYSLPEPYRHHHVISAILRHIYDCKMIRGELQGFLNNEGKYVDRYVARVLAETSTPCQLLPDAPEIQQLFSEEVWGTPGDWRGIPESEERKIFEYNHDPDVIDSKLQIRDISHDEQREQRNSIG